MIVLKTSKELSLMREAGRIANTALHMGGKAVEPGVSTFEIDAIVRKCIEDMGGKPSSLGYCGFPASSCISINNEVIHGIPNRNTKVKEGDIVSIDITASFNGYNADNAATFAAGSISQKAQALLDATKKALHEGIKMAVAGGRMGDIGSAIQRYVEARGYSVVRDFIGHGVGTDMHEDPSVPNFGTPGRGIKLLPGMTLAIEPMVNAGRYDVRVLADGWTVLTVDGSLSAHFEHTVAITTDGPVILTCR